MTGEPTPHVEHAVAEGAVDAVLLSRDGARWLPATLDALVASTRAPRRLVLVDLDGTLPELVPGVLRCPVDVVDARSARSLADGLGRGLAVLDEREPVRAGLVWLLTDDVAPAPDALARLVDAARTQPDAGILGPKHLAAQRDGRLVEVGLRTTRSGRPYASPRHGEIDQGQHDHRSDVLAVSIGGALVRREVLDGVGLDPAFRGDAASVDLGWRAHQAGHRVVVVPSAGVHDERAEARGLRGLDPMPFVGRSADELRELGYGRSEIARERRGWDRERRGRARRAERSRRRGLRLVALTRCPWWQAPFRGLGLVLTSVVTALALLLLKRPRAAWAELSDLGALAHPVASLRSRWRARRTGRRRGLDMRRLFASPGAALRSVLDEMYLALPHLPDEAAHADPLAPPAEPGPVDDEALDLPAPAVGINAGAVAAVLALAVAALTWRTVLRSDPAAALGQGLVGGELTGANGSAGDLVRAYLTGWVPEGLGHASTDTPWTVVLAGLAWVVGVLPGRDPGASVGTAVSLVMLLAIPASALTAYLAGRSATLRPWPRAAAALVWAFLPTLSLGLGAGRLGAAAGHVLLPVVLAGLAHAARRHPVAWVVGCTVLVAAVAAAFVPLLGVVVALAGLVLALRPGHRSAGSRTAGWALAIVPLALQGPVLLAWARAPWRLLLGPGLVDRDDALPKPWQLALGWPALPPAGDVVPASWGPWVPLVTAPIVLAGVLAMTRRGRADAGLTRLAVLALVALVLVLFLPRLTVAQDWRGGDLVDLVAWPGVALDLVLLALLAAILAAVDRRTTRDLAGRPHRAAAVAATLVLGLTAVVLGARLVLAPVDTGLAAASDPLPDAARGQATSDLASRTLVLTPTSTSGQGAPRVDYRLVGRETGDLVLGLPESSDPHDAVTEAVRAAVDGTRADSAARFHDLGVGFVTLDGDASTATDLAGHLDTTAGLARIVGAGAPTWRVLPVTAAGGESVLPSRVRALGSRDGQPAVIAAIEAPRGGTDAQLPAGTTSLALAETVEAARHLEVRVDGHLLTPSAGPLGLSRYDVPAGARHLTIGPRPAHPAWSWTQAVLLALCLLAALPFGVRARPRRRSVR